MAQASQYPLQVLDDVKEKLQLVSELEQLLLDLDIRKQRAQTLLDSLKDQLAPHLVPSASLESASSQTSLMTLDFSANSKAPIHRFPTEIFSMIFALVLIPYHPRIRSLLLVCKHWNEMVMQNPKLWSRLQIIAPIDPQTYPWRTWLDDLRRYLSACLHRSRALLLSVKIDLSQLPSSSEYIADQVLTYAKTIIPSDHNQLSEEVTSMAWQFESPEWEEFIDDICNLLFKEPYYKIERWVALSLRFPNPDLAISEEIWNYITGVASNLKELSIENLHCTHGEPSMVDDFPALESLTIKQSTISLRAFPFSSDNLRHLQIPICGSTQDLQDLLLSPHLITLELTVAGHLALYGIPSFKLRLPILQKFVIKGQYAILKNMVFDFPSLKILEIETNGQLDALPNVAPLRIDWTVIPRYSDEWKARPILNAITTLMKFSKSTQVIILPKLAAPYAGNAAHHLMVTGELAMLPCLKGLVVDQGNGKYSTWSLRDKALLEKMAARVSEARARGERGDMG